MTRPFRYVVVAAVALTLGAGIAALARGGGAETEGPAIAPTSTGGTVGTTRENPRVLAEGEQVTIYNKVTSGSKMREDQPVVLSFEAAVCQHDACVVSGTKYNSGDQISVVCQRRGERVTNGDDTTKADDDNPQLADSRLWYGLRTDAGRLAYISEVWVEPEYRGGMGLPSCETVTP